MWPSKISDNSSRVSRASLVGLPMLHQLVYAALPLAQFLGLSLHAALPFFLGFLSYINI